MAIGKKVSPAKFIGTLALAAGIGKGISSIVGGIREKKRLRRDQKRAKKQFQQLKADIEGIQITNPFADMQTDFENPFEDLTINQQQADFEADQAARSRANVLSSLRGSAGSSGIAGLAQVLANQTTVDTARASASIGQQEARNQRLAAQGAAQVQAREFDAQQVVASGELQRQERESDRALAIAQARAGKQAQIADLRNQRRQAQQQIMGGITNIGTSVIGGIAGGMTGTGDNFFERVESSFGANADNPFARDILFQQLGFNTED